MIKPSKIITRYRICIIVNISTLDCQARNIKLNIRKEIFKPVSTNSKINKICVSATAELMIYGLKIILN